MPGTPSTPADMIAIAWRSESNLAFWFRAVFRMCCADAECQARVPTQLDLDLHVLSPYSQTPKMPAPTSKASTLYRTMRKGLDNPKHAGSASTSGDSSVLDSPAFGNMDVLPSELVVWVTTIVVEKGESPLKVFIDL